MNFQNMNTDPHSMLRPILQTNAMPSNHDDGNHISDVDCSCRSINTMNLLYCAPAADCCVTNTTACLEGCTPCLECLSCCTEVCSICVQ